MVAILKAMSPRRSAAAARQTRADIVECAMDVASIEGLEGFSLGRLASALQMSKSGVLGHFSTKEELQHRALQGAVEVFTREVWEAASSSPPGLSRLLAICDAWIDYLERGVFPGGCFLTAASCEFDGRPGAIRDQIAAVMKRWLLTLRIEAQRAIEAGELPAATDPATVAFQLNALAMGANQAIQLFGDHGAGKRALGAMRATLGPALGPVPGGDPRPPAPASERSLNRQAQDPE